MKVLVPVQPWYQYNHGYQPKGSWNQSLIQFQPDKSLPVDSSLSTREHVDYIAQGNKLMKPGPLSFSIRAKVSLHPAQNGSMTPSGPMSGQYLELRHRRAQTSWETASASMPKNSSCPTLRMPYQLLWTSPRPLGATRVSSRMLGQRLSLWYWALHDPEWYAVAYRHNYRL